MTPTSTETTRTMPRAQVQTQPARSVAHAGRRITHTLGWLLQTSALYLLLIVLAVIFVFPFLWSFLTSVKSTTEVFDPGIALPAVWRFDNYIQAVQSYNLLRYLFNSTFVSLVVALAHIALASTAGFAFARLHFPGRDLLFVLVVATLMVPSQATLVPLFILVKEWPLFGGNDIWGNGGFGMLDSYWALTVPLFATAYGTFLLRQFFLTLPADLEDAARIDG
ncbi:MAG: carbohydrate ABC transporter permease, partial [Caldilineaceae bacterium]|nr:carbohydrate ABC transporter permease [Caldilineaceae bacterium]